MLLTADGGLIRPAEYSGTRRVRIRSSRTCTGSLVLSDEFERRVEFESKLERDAILVMNARPDVLRVSTQEPRVAYEDRSGKGHFYTFDLRVELRDGTVVAVEVKPEKYVAKRRVRELLALIAAQTPRSVAVRVTLITERDLDDVTVANAELIHASRFPDADADERVRGALRRAAGSVSVADIAGACGLGPRAVGAVARLIRSGEARLDAHERIGMRARVRASRFPEARQERKAA